MTMQSEVSRGWTIAEAVERTAPPDVWEEWIAAKAAWTKVKAPIPSGPSAFITRSPQEIEHLRLAANAAFKKARDNLWKLLQTEALVAVGSREGPAAQPSPIHALAWKSLSWPRIEKSTVRERYGAKARIYSVRVFPLAYAPDAANRLNGLSLSEAFQRFVLDDPEVVALGEVVMRKEGHADVFRQGQAPGYIESFHWRLGVSSEDLAYAFVQSLSLEYSPEPSRSIVAAATALSNRLEALRHLLTDGIVVAAGTFVKTGAESPIGRRQWSRKGLLIEVRNSDLCEEENYRPVPSWTGIEFQLPTPTSYRVEQEDSSTPTLARSTNGVGSSDDSVDQFEVQSHAEAAKAVAPAKAKSPQRESIAEAVRSIWPEGLPKGLMVVKRNQLITSWQRDNGLAITSDKTISRYFSDAQSPS